MINVEMVVADYRPRTKCKPLAVKSPRGDKIPKQADSVSRREAMGSVMFLTTGCFTLPQSESYFL